MKASQAERTHAETIAYAHVSDAQPQLLRQLRELMDRGARRFCDVGGGANPIVASQRIQRLGLEYVVFDDSRQELDKTPDGYTRFEGSVLDSERVASLLARGGGFDVVASRWTAEHMPDGERFHRQVFDMLRPGGTAVHLFPTLYSPVFVVNRLLPSAASARLLNSGRSDTRTSGGRHAKFHSYYSWCRGPSSRQIARLESVGFTVERYVGYFGHNYYTRVKPLDLAQRVVTDMLLARPTASLTSFALVVLRRS